MRNKSFELTNSRNNIVSEYLVHDFLNSIQPRLWYCKYCFNCPLRTLFAVFSGHISEILNICDVSSICLVGSLGSHSHLLYKLSQYRKIICRLWLNILYWISYGMLSTNCITAYLLSFWLNWSFEKKHLESQTIWLYIV